MFRSPVTPASVRRQGWLALGLVAGMLLASPGPSAQAAPSPAQAPKNPYVFANDGAILLNFIKPDKVAEWEMILAKLKEALNKSDKPERKQQAASWKVFKVTETGAGGAAIYASIIYPAVKDADYTVSKILEEGFPTEANALLTTYSGVFATPAGNLLNLTMFSDLAK